MAGRELKYGGIKGLWYPFNKVCLSSSCRQNEYYAGTETEQRTDRHPAVREPAGKWGSRN